MSLSSLAIIPLPQRNSIVAPDSLARLRDSVGVAVDLPPTESRRAFARNQLGAIGTNFVLLLEADETLDAASTHAHLEARQCSSASPVDQFFRVASLRAALRAPLIDGENIYDEIAGDWLRFNLAAHALARAEPPPPLPLSPPRTARQALNALAFVHQLFCHCPVLPQAAPPDAPPRGLPCSPGAAGGSFFRARPTRSPRFSTARRPCR